MFAPLAMLHDSFPVLLSSALLAYAILVGRDHCKKMMALYRLIRRSRLDHSYWKIAHSLLVMLVLGLSALYPMGESCRSLNIC